MKVSIVVPTYKRDSSLKKALESLSRQTFKDFEVVLVDDNDNPEWNSKVQALVDEFSNDNQNVSINYIENHPNLGSANARNAGINAAQGEYVTFLDDDDIYLPEKISHQLEKMEQEDADFSFTDLYLYNENDKLTDKRVRSYIEKTDSDSLLEYHLMYHMTGTDTMMFRTEYLQKIGGFPPIDVGDEFYLMTSAITGGGKFSYVPGCFVKAYVHTGEGGLSSGQSKIDGENTLYDYKKKFFNQLEKKKIRYIKMRHHAVLAFAYLRIKKYGKFVSEGIKSFVNSPAGCLKMLKER